ncbi:GNAT family N-acetyltransferase [Vulcaniibacterium tengchongense]|uniref:Putative acetyltransferase n=1 Tax=Vulcaniibacterium tengchongense TaxID=1273429 RepID=A0A3N4VF40_9GAMM|nr:N-acetyltransferase [Vulcaniibacterium tengchongense]RPE75797.1 putative acetyltransferase [Vulcaniibacterium tengchongense]
MWIRTETEADHAAIDAVLAAAFAGAPGHGEVERRIVRALRAAGALTLSLVADIDGRVAGHVAFSPVAIGDAAGWYGLGPLAVAPADQGHGVGGALVRAGLVELERLRAAGCVVLGDPGYYGRFGFAVRPGLRYPGVPSEYFMALPLDEHAMLPQGEARYHAAFAAAG